MHILKPVLFIERRFQTYFNVVILFLQKIRVMAYFNEFFGFNVWNCHDL